MSDVVHSPAVHGQHLGGDPACSWRGQEDYCIGNVLRLANAAHHCLGGEAFLCSLPIASAAAVLRHVSSDKARCHRASGTRHGRYYAVNFRFR
jgi:hypothetical protein